MTARICYITLADLIAAAKLRLSAAVSALNTCEKRDRKHWAGVARRERRCVRDLERA